MYFLKHYLGLKETHISRFAQADTCPRFQKQISPQGFFTRLKTASAIPPRINAPARNKRLDTASERITTPLHAAITGTESWTIAARVVVRPRSAVYQITYPTPEATAPESVASHIPFVERWILFKVSNRIDNTIGTAYIKFPAVSASGFSDPRQRME